MSELKTPANESPVFTRYADTNGGRTLYVGKCETCGSFNKCDTEEQRAKWVTNHRLQHTAPDAATRISDDWGGGCDCEECQPEATPAPSMRRSDPDRHKMQLQFDGDMFRWIERERKIHALGRTQFVRMVLRHAMDRPGMRTYGGDG